MSHFLLALALVSVALRMRQRAREVEGPRPIVTPLARRAVGVVYVWTIAAVIAGTLVTAAGPHGGDREARRLTWPIVDVVRVHGAGADARRARARSRLGVRLFGPAHRGACS